MTMVGFLVTLVKAGIVFALLALTVKMLRRYDRRQFGTASRTRSGAASRRGRGAARSGRAGSGLRPGGRGTARPGLFRSRAKRPEPILDVVERAPLGRTSSAILVRVHDQHFLFGVTDTQVTMLLEVDLPTDEVDDGIDGIDGTVEEIDLRPTGADGEPAEGRVPQPVSFKAELLRQARQYLPGASRTEAIDPSSLPIGEDR